VFTTTAGEVEAIWDNHKRLLPAGLTQQQGVPVHRVPLRHLPPAPYGYYAVRRLTVALAQLPGVPAAALWPLANFTPWAPGLPAALDGAPGPVDLVHGFTIPFESLLRAGRDHARARNAPFVVTPFLHSGESHDPSVERGYAMPHQLDLLREAGAVVALTPIERDFLLRRGLRPERVHVIPAGIPVEAAALAGPVPPPAEPPTVLFLGAATYDKGAVHLMQAMRLLEAEGVEVRLAIAGTVTSQFQQAIARAPALERLSVAVLGVAPAAEKERLLRECVALAMPSRVDSFGLVYLEAWAAGRPVIGARAGGVPAVIDHETNGLLVPFGDVPAIAAAIRRLVERPGEAAAMGLAGREKLRRCYTWEAVFPQVSDLYDRLLRR
jgi:glycosyltransferase involved in cell wall biosynthesis